MSNDCCYVEVVEPLLPVEIAMLPEVGEQEEIAFLAEQYIEFSGEVEVVEWDGVVEIVEIISGGTEGPPGTPGVAGDPPALQWEGDLQPVQPTWNFIGNVEVFDEPAEDRINIDIRPQIQQFQLDGSFLTESRVWNFSGDVDAVYNAIDGRIDIDVQGGGHTVLDEAFVAAPQRANLLFVGLDVSDNIINDATVVTLLRRDYLVNGDPDYPELVFDENGEPMWEEEVGGL